MNLDQARMAIGNFETSSDQLSSTQLKLLADTLTGATHIRPTDLPLGWQWAFFHKAIEQSKLGRDGHEKLGGFIPDLPLKRRMWAGGEIHFHNQPITDQLISRTSTIKEIETKQGKSGDLIFVTLEHAITQNETSILTETQNLVYREEVSHDAAHDTKPKTSGKVLIDDTPEHSLEVTPSPLFMFRYSALTFNGHRIHYDADYARNVEGYNGIVFHGPLTATLMQNFAQETLNAPLKHFSFKATSPIDSFDTFKIHMIKTSDGAKLWAQKHDGATVMLATATL